jgi:hypothetical protein
MTRDTPGIHRLHHGSNLGTDAEPDIETEDVETHVETDDGEADARAVVGHSRFRVADFAGILDDAAVFPPGNAAVPEAVRAHLARRAQPWSALVGPLVVSTGHLAQVAAAIPDGERIAVIVVVRDLALVPEVVRITGAEPRIELRAVELAVSGESGTAAANTAVRQYLPLGVDVWIEPGWDEDAPAAMDRIAAAGHRLKLRTGGTTANAFPSPVILAAAVVAAVSRGLAFKATAGLHSALRHRDPVTGFEHHGFANLLLAAARASDGLTAVTSALTQVRGDVVAQGVLELGPDGLRAVRTQRFVSFGTCDVAEPLRDLLALGLLARPEVTR